MSILERDAHLALIAAPGGSDGDPGIRHVVVRGAPGEGRTALLAAARHAAVERGVRVRATRCTELDAAVPLAAVRRLLEPLDAPAPDPQAAAEAIAAAARAGPAPLLLTVDDGQWTDDASLEALARLALLGGPPELTVVVAIRDGERAAARPAVRALERVAAHHLRVEPLGLDSVSAMARAALRRPGRATSNALHRVSAGCPLLVAAILDELAGTAPQDGDVEAALPAAAEAHVRARLERLEADEIELARACAIAEPCSLHLAARIAGLDAERALMAADGLVAARLLAAGEPLRFRQPIAAGAVRRSVTLSERSRLHARAAEFLDADGAPVTEVALHLAETPAAGDDRSVALLRHGADAAMKSGRPALASRLLGRAAAEPPGPDERAETLVGLGWARLAAGEPAPAEPLSAALNRPGAATTAEDWHRLARLLMASGEPRAAAAAVARGREALPGAEADELLLAEAFAAAVVMPPLDAAFRDRLDTLGAQAGEGRFPAAMALRAALAFHLACTGASAPVVERVALSAFEESPMVDVDRLGVGLSFAVSALVAVDSTPITGGLLDAAVEDASAKGWPLAAAAGATWRALVRLRTGRFDEARRDRDRALGVRTTPSAPHLMLAGPAIAEAHVKLGDLDEAEALLTRLERRSPMRLLARGQIKLARGDTAGALADFETAGVAFETIGITSPAIAPWRSSAAIAAHRLGRQAAARALAAFEVDLARRIGAPRPLAVALRAAALVGPRNQGLELLEEAVAVLDRSPSRLLRVRAMLDLGSARRRAGLRASAREPLARAFELASSCGASALAELAMAELRAAGARPRRAARTGTAALTPSERRVAELAAEGLASAEIAQRLFVSRKTVESHLQRSYQKLGIRSRGQLAGMFARD